MKINTIALALLFAIQPPAHAQGLHCTAKGIQIPSYDSISDLIQTVAKCVPGGKGLNVLCSSEFLMRGNSEITFFHPAAGVSEVTFLLKNGTLKGFISQSSNRLEDIKFGKMILKAEEIPASMNLFQALNTVVVKNGCKWVK